MKKYIFWILLAAVIILLLVFFFKGTLPFILGGVAALILRWAITGGLQGNEHEPSVTHCPVRMAAPAEPAGPAVPACHWPPVHYMGMARGQNCP